MYNNAEDFHKKMLILHSSKNPEKNIIYQIFSTKKLTAFNIDNKKMFL